MFLKMAPLGSKDGKVRHFLRTTRADKLQPCMGQALIFAKGSHVTRLSSIRYFGISIIDEDSANSQVVMRISR